MINYNYKVQLIEKAKKSLRYNERFKKYSIKIIILRLSFLKNVTDS